MTTAVTINQHLPEMKDEMAERAAKYLVFVVVQFMSALHTMPSGCKSQ